MARHAAAKRDGPQVLNELRDDEPALVHQIPGRKGSP
jgi:hypothetical protein